MGFLSKVFKSVTHALPFGIGDALSHEDDKQFASDSSALAYQRQVEMYQNRHQWEVEDLKKSGLNPILSVTNGVGSMPTVQQAVTPSGSSSGSQNTDALLGLVNAALKKKEIDVEDKKADAQVMDASTNSARQKQEALESDKRIESIDFTNANTKANTALISAQIQETFQRTLNSAKLTAAQVRQCDAIAFQANALGIAQSNLANAQAEYAATQSSEVKRKMNSYETQVKEQTAKLQKEVRDTPMGKSSFQLGTLFGDLLQLTGVAGKAGGVSFRK